MVEVEGEGSGLLGIVGMVGEELFRVEVEGIIVFCEGIVCKGYGKVKEVGLRVFEREFD